MPHPNTQAMVRLSLLRVVSQEIERGVRKAGGHGDGAMAEGMCSLQSKSYTGHGRMVRAGCPGSPQNSCVTLAEPLLFSKLYVFCEIREIKKLPCLNIKQDAHTKTLSEVMNVVLKGRKGELNPR